MEIFDAMNTVSSAIERAEKAYRKRVKDEVFERAEVLCDLCEELSTEFGAIDLTVMVSNVLECITISADAAEMTFHHGRSHPFFAAIKSCDRVSFSRIHDGIRVTFRIDNIWEEK